MSTNLNAAPIDAAVPSDVEKLEKGALHRRTSPGSYDEKVAAEVAHDEAEVAQAQEHKSAFYARFRPYVLATTAIVILGWWVSATVLPATRHRWIVQTLFAWFFIFVILFRFVPTTVISRPVEAIWEPAVQRPFFALAYRTRLALGWFALVAIVLGSAYGFPLTNVSHSALRHVLI
jgi:CNT family concentrative nucleoside transporter